MEWELIWEPFFILKLIFLTKLVKLHLKVKIIMIFIYISTILNSSWSRSNSFEKIRWVLLSYVFLDDQAESRSKIAVVVQFRGEENKTNVTCMYGIHKILRTANSENIIEANINNCKFTTILCWSVETLETVMPACLLPIIQFDWISLRSKGFHGKVQIYLSHQSTLVYLEMSRKISFRPLIPLNVSSPRSEGPVYSHVQVFIACISI